MVDTKTFQTARSDNRTFLKRFFSNTKGAVALIAGLSVPVIAGTTGLAMDAGSWYFTVRTLQTAADAAAMAGANQLSNGLGLANIRAAAFDDAQLNGYDATGTGTFIVHHPPLDGAYAGDNQAIEIILSERAPLYFSSLFLSEGVTVTTKAVAKQFMQADMCMVALDKDGGPGLSISGNVDLIMDCGMAANTTAANALDINGAANITASTLWTMGDITDNGSGIVDVDYKFEQASEIDDPYKDLEIPPYGGCDYTNTKINTGTVTLSPGVYCGGIAVGANATVTLDTGEYIIDGGDLSITGQGDLNGTDVSLFFTSSSGSDYGTVKIAGGGDVTLAAPTSGPNQGLLIYVDRNAPEDSSDMGGNATGDLQGVVYMPTHTLTFHGTAGAGDGCLNLIANRISVVGDVNLTNDCYLAGVENPVSLRVRLVQ